MQPILSSSYLGFGNGNLGRDTEEIGALMNYLVCHRDADNFAVVGHSTGCQNSIHFVKYGDSELVERVKVCLLTHNGVIIIIINSNLLLFSVLTLSSSLLFKHQLVIVNLSPLLLEITMQT